MPVVLVVKLLVLNFKMGFEEDVCLIACRLLHGLGI